MEKGVVIEKLQIQIIFIMSYLDADKSNFPLLSKDVKTSRVRPRPSRAKDAGAESKVKIKRKKKKKMLINPDCNICSR